MATRSSKKSLKDVKDPKDGKKARDRGVARSGKTAADGKKRPITKEDLLTLAFVRGGAISPDGAHYVFPVQSVRKDRKGYDSHLHVAALDGSGVRQFTFGKKSDGSPTVSPDGSLIALVSKRGHHPGIHLLPVTGGEARPLVQKDGTFTDLSFSPDGTKILCAFRPNDPPGWPEPEKKGKGATADSTEDATDEDKPPRRDPPVYRHIERLWYRMDGEGFLPREPYHLWIFDLESGEGTQLTKGKRDALQPAFSPDGRWITYVQNTRPDPDVEPYWTDLFVMPAAGGQARRIPTPPGPVSGPRVAPDGKMIAYVGHDDIKTPWYENPRIWVVPFDGTGKARCLCPDFDQVAYDATIGDTGEGFCEMPPRWTPDGKWIYFISSGWGWSALYRVQSSGGKPERVTPDKTHLIHVAVSNDCRRAAGVVSHPTMPPEAFAFDLPSGKARRLSHLSEAWARELDLQEPERVTVPSTDGIVIEGWILKPPGFSPRTKYPAILEVHGGPQCQYGYTFFHELQLLAASGFVVLYTNPRGSAGYGRAFAEAIKNDWGGKDFVDVMAATDYLERLPYVDAKRIGITGGSYGGYMTNWAIGHTDRYKAAVTQRSVVDLVPFFGSSDFGFDFHHTFGGHPWENLEGYRRQSPLTYAKNIRTPLLILHSEQDLRCSIEQAENLFATLKMLKRKVELVRFPEESHGLSRGGRPDRRLARLEKIVGWFQKHL